jgi:AcrR family transcriptional regulator
MSSEIRQRILEAATLCFTQQGYTGSRIQDICRMAQVSPATFYRHFGSKRALFEAVGIPESSGIWVHPRRNDILEAALDLLSQQGYHGTTMAEIAARAGVARATLYAQFPTKAALLEALLEENLLVDLVHHFPATSPEFEGMMTPEELECLARQFLQSFQDPRRVALLRLILAEGTRFPPLQRAYHHMVSTGVNIISHYLSSLIPGLVDPGFTAHTYLGSLLAFVLTEHIVPGSSLPVYPPEEIAHQVTTQVLIGASRSVNAGGEM